MFSQQTFSPSTLKAVTDVVTGGPGGSSHGPPPIGRYRTAGEIEQFMMECDLDFQIGIGSRVTTLLSFFRSLASQDPYASVKITRVIEHVAAPEHYVHDPERQQAVITHLNRFLTRDGMEVTFQSGRPRLVTCGRSGAVVAAVVATATNFDFDTVRRDIERALESADNDPEDAVTAACSTIESVCRSILVELNLELPARKDIDGLVKAVQAPLGLSPGRSGLPEEIAADVRQVLSGLTTTAKGIGALRTHAGDAHGRERGFKRIDGRIARLAIHGASTLALFLIETWEKKERRPLPQKGSKKAV